ncbi:unnamed protein product [Adineta steineri]|uniref:Uncharacterized protein n=1 Tax=Adineta steineri TaxID=433720 RepID=A0A815IID6_9BILA|nr:unnamed protein product [Adineta steineri]CAF3990978.1 unnamed protein product [Adineta steineri]
MNILLLFQNLHFQDQQLYKQFLKATNSIRIYCSHYFNETFSQFHVLLRIKSHQLICQQISPNLKYFEDSPDYPKRPICACRSYIYGS